VETTELTVFMETWCSS